VRGMQFVLTVKDAPRLARQVVCRRKVSLRRTTSVVKLIPSSADSCAGVIRMSTPGDRRSHMLELA
jgi:hypothetical protein